MDRRGGATDPRAWAAGVCVRRATGGWLPGSEDQMRVMWAVLPWLAALVAAPAVRAG